MKFQALFSRQVSSRACHPANRAPILAAIVPPQPIWPEVKEPMAQSSSDGSEDCAICFEPVHADDRLPLPCRCQLTYCLTCWDRALAAAFNDSGQGSPKPAPEPAPEAGPEPEPGPEPKP